MSAISDLLIHRCDRVRYDIANDVEFGKVNVPVVVQGDVPCRFQPRSAAKGRTAGQWAMDVSHVMYAEGVLPADVQFLVVWRAGPDTGNLTGADRTFEVRGMHVPDELGEYCVLGLREFDPYANADPVEG